MRCSPVLPRHAPTPSLLLLLIAALLALAGCAGKDAGDGSSKGPQNGVWEKGEAWKVLVTQDGGDVTPDGAGSTSEIAYRFRVAEKPTSTRPTWRVHVTQEGAEGPFAKGWELYYEEEGKRLVLDSVAFAEQEPVDAEQASIVLGLGFPLEQSYSKPPVDKKVDGDELLEQASGNAPSGDLPPSLPNDSATPGDTPTIEGTGAPVT